MKKPVLVSVCALALAAVILWTAIPAHAEYAGSYYMYVRTGDGGSLHLRALPSTQSQSLGLYPYGTAVLVESISGNWARVWVNGQEGYMSLTYLSTVPPGQPTQAPAEEILYVRTGNSGRLHLREYASQSARSLGLYPNGTAVRVIQRYGQWVYVNINGALGFMMSQYLSAQYDPQPTVSPDTPVLMYVGTGNSGRLHLREYPSQSARSLGLFANGTPVYAVDLGTGWCRVTVNGLTGYMMSRYLTAGYCPAPTPTPAPQSGTVMYVSTGNSGRLHLRESMSTGSPSLGLYANGTPVTVIYNYGAWAYVNVYGKVGYMMTCYLSAQPGGGSAPVITPTPAPTPGPMNTATVVQPNGSFVYLRTYPNSSSTVNVICQVPSGSIVTVVEWGPYWSIVRYNGQEGYMVTQYLK